MDVDDTPFLDTVPGEISFFRSITRSRPVGIHRYFHVLSIQQIIKRETGVEVTPESLWQKLESCYDLEALENLEIGGYDSSDSDSSQPHSIPSPIPGENLSSHAHFRSEFQLPWADYDPIIALRRVSETSPPASPISLPRRNPKSKVAPTASERASSRRGSFFMAAGLVGGNSDSSSLTENEEENADLEVESARHSRRNSVMTGTPTEGTVEEEEEDPPAGGSPLTSSSTRGRRGRGRGTPVSRRPAATPRRTTRRR